MAFAVAEGHDTQLSPGKRPTREEAGPTALTAELGTPVPPEPEQVDSLIGTTIGSFKIVRKLGKGGMGTVYLGEQTVIGSKVAVKVLHEHLATNPSLVARFYAEARAVNLIGHENIVSIFDMNVVPPNRYYLIMEYLEGRSLASMTKRPMDPAVAIPILLQACDALQAAHANGVVHRDLKPENIFLVKRARTEHFVKLVDFGIAKLFSTEVTGQTSSGTIIGTPEYMSPEQCSGDPVDGRADLYALGVITYQMATGKLPFIGGGLTGVLMAHLDRPPAPPHEVLPSVPKAWSQVILRALAKRPADRYQTAAEMARALEEVLMRLRSGEHRTPAKPQPAASSAPTPAPAAPAMPTQAKVTPMLQARVLTPAGELLGLHPCVDLSRGGVFICTGGALPPLLSRVKVVLVQGEAEVSSAAEVVRHVAPSQATAWRMPPGYGVQFVDASPPFKESVARLMKGELLGSAAAAPGKDDAQAAVRLEQYRKRLIGDSYAALGLPPDAEPSEIRQRAREARSELEAIGRLSLSSAQRAELERVLEQLRGITDTLSQPARRAEYDAERGNYRGVARCLSAGLTVTELEKARARYLASRPNAESRASFHFVTGNAWEGKGQNALALEEYEKALALDPLNLRVHQRYWSLKRRPATPPPVTR